MHWLTCRWFLPSPTGEERGLIAIRFFCAATSSVENKTEAFTTKFSRQKNRRGKKAIKPIHEFGGKIKLTENCVFIEVEIDYQNIQG